MSKQNAAQPQPKQSKPNMRRRVRKQNKKPKRVMAPGPLELRTQVHQQQRNVPTKALSAHVAALAPRRSGVSVLLKQMMDPTHSPLVRIPMDGSSWESVGTAVAKNFYAADYDFFLQPATDFSNLVALTRSRTLLPLLSDDTYQIIITLRDVIVPMIILTTRALSSGAIPEVTFGTVPQTRINDVDSSTADVVFGSIYTSGEPIKLVLSDWEFFSGPSGGSAEYLKRIPVGLNSLPGSLFWVDAGPSTENASALVTLEVDCLSAASQTNALVGMGFAAWRVYGDKDEIQEVEAKFTAVATTTSIKATLAINVSGYFKLGIIPYSMDVAAGFEFAWQTLTVAFRAKYATNHYTLESYDKFKDVVEAMRVSGQSLLLTNVAPEISLQGTVISMAIPQVKPWYEITSDLKGTVFEANASLYDRRSWAKGLYYFNRPNGSGESYSLVRSYVDFDGYRHPNFRPFENNGNVITAIKRPSTAVAGSGSPANISIMLTRAFEFTTMTQMFDVRVANNNPSEYEAFIAAVVKAKQFHDNPFHWSDIGSFIAKAADAVTKYAPYVVKGANAAKQIFG